MKKLLLLLSLIILSCSNEGIINEPRETFTKEITYCSQDNLVRIDGEWIQSIYLGSYEPANDIFSAYLLEGKLELESVNYEIASVTLSEVSNQVEISGNMATLSIPDLELYLFNSDWFYLEVEFYKAQ